MLGAARLFLMTGLIASPVPPSPSGDALILRNATVLDGVHAEPLRRATIVIRNGRIVAIGGASLQYSGKAIDLDGKWLMPGLIDAHVHLGKVEDAKRALLSGITTVRSLGGPNYEDVQLKILHQHGQADIPDELASGYQLTRTPSPALLASRPDIRALFDQSRFADAMTAIARLNVAYGVDVIKVLATERAGLPETNPMKRNLSDLELRTAVMEARRRKLPVAAHAHSDAGARAAVLAGVSTIEHGTYLSVQTLRLMKRRRICLVPTISRWSQEWDGIDDNPVLTARARSMAPHGIDSARRARRVGVRLVAGSDATYGSKRPLRLVDEIAALVGTGMSPYSALQSATSTAADCLGIAGRTGRVKVGLEADLLVLDQDPRLDLDTLRRPRLVINDGVIALDKMR